MTSKLAIIIANRDVERTLTNALLAEKFFLTRIGSRGGFLRKKNITLLLGLAEERVEKLLSIVTTVGSEKNSLVSADTEAPLATEAGLPELPLGAAALRTGGATVFILAVEKTLRV